MLILLIMYASPRKQLAAAIWKATIGQIQAETNHICLIGLHVIIMSDEYCTVTK